jgi:hypothetical protein
MGKSSHSRDLQTGKICFCGWVLPKSGSPAVNRWSPDLHLLIDKLSSISGLDDLSLTTNGSLLTEQVESLAQAGLKRINVSLDTLDPEVREAAKGNLEKSGRAFAARSSGPAPHQNKRGAGARCQ